VGILILGTGISMLLEASHLKYSDVSQWRWIAFGTISLIVFMAGFVTAVDSVRFRIRYEQDKDQEKKS
jgi:divalent metal cation (Fe/Co/Zn/Cd) transporter